MAHDDELKRCDLIEDQAKKIFTDAKNQQPLPLWFLSCVKNDSKMLSDDQTPMPSVEAFIAIAKTMAKEGGKKQLALLGDALVDIMEALDEVRVQALEAREGSGKKREDHVIRTLAELGRLIIWYEYKRVYIYTDRKMLNSADIKFFITNARGIKEDSLGYMIYVIELGCYFLELPKDLASTIVGHWTCMSIPVHIYEEPLPKDHKDHNAEAPSVIPISKDANILELPTEVIITICDNLSFFTLVNFAQVSNQCKNIACAPYLWKSLCDKVFPTIANGKDVANWKEEFVHQRRLYAIMKHKFTLLHEERMRQRHWMRCGVHMFHPVNGRCGFDLVKPSKELIDSKPPLDKMVAMLKREEELRLSDAVQAKFSNPDNDAIHVAAHVQEQVIEEFGYKDKKAVDYIRCAPGLYPKNELITRIPHYQKFNRARQGDLTPGKPAPQAKLAYLNGTNVMLHDYMATHFSNGKPTVIISGSYT